MIFLRDETLKPIKIAINKQYGENLILSPNDLSMALSGNLEAVAAGLGETDASLEAAQKDAFTIRTPEQIAKSAAEAAKPAFGEIANTFCELNHHCGK